MTSPDTLPAQGWDVSFPRLAKATGRMLGALFVIEGVLIAAHQEPQPNEDFKTVQEAVAENMAASGQPPAESSPVPSPTESTPPTEAVPQPPPSPMPQEMINPPCIETTIPWLPESVARWHPYVEQSARIHGVSAELMDVLMFFESVGNPIADSISVPPSVGVLQIWIPSGESMLKALGLPPLDLWDPATNIYLAGKHLRDGLNLGVIDISQGYNAEAVRRLAIHYHGGEGTLNTYLRYGLEFLRADSPYTTRYSEWVTRAWEERHMPTSSMHDEYMRMSGPRDEQAEGANLGTPPC